MAALKHVWKEEGPKLISMPKEALSIGQVSHRNKAAAVVLLECPPCCSDCLHGLEAGGCHELELLQVLQLSLCHLADEGG